MNSTGDLEGEIEDDELQDGELEDGELEEGEIEDGELQGELEDGELPEEEQSVETNSTSVPSSNEERASSVVMAPSIIKTRKFEKHESPSGWLTQRKVAHHTAERNNELEELWDCVFEKMEATVSKSTNDEKFNGYPIVNCATPNTDDGKKNRNMKCKKEHKDDDDDDEGKRKDVKHRQRTVGRILPHNNRPPRKVTQNKRGGPKRQQPSRKNPQRVCVFWMQGICQKGNSCTYSHSSIPQRKLELCKFYVMDCCAKKEKCSYMHNDFPCKFFHTGQKCFSGPRCKFSHGHLSDTIRSILLKGTDSDHHNKTRMSSRPTAPAPEHRSQV